MFKCIPFKRQYWILTNFRFVIKFACVFFFQVLIGKHSMQWINTPASRERKLDFQFLTYDSSSICCTKNICLISIRFTGIDLLHMPFKSTKIEQGKSEGFESCHRPIVRKRPIWAKIVDVLYRVTLKFDGWPWKTIGHLSFTVSSFVQHFIAIGEFWVKFDDF